MPNVFDEMRRMLREAADIQRAADNNAEDMAGMLCGRLRRVSHCTLVDLKRELRDFNMVTGKWKEPK